MNVDFARSVRWSARAALVSASLVGGYLAAGFAPSTGDVFAGPSAPDRAHPRARAVWQHHLEVVEASIDGPSSEEALWNALEFFYELTGIEIAFDHGYIGLLPNEQTPESVAELKRWYSSNSHRLGWDTSRQRLTLSRKLGSPYVRGVDDDSGLSLHWIRRLPPKGRAQDAGSEVVDRLLSSWTDGVPFLIDKLLSERPYEPPILDFWPSMTEGDVALILLTDFFRSPAGETSFSELCWDSLMGGSGDPWAPAWVLLEERLRSIGRPELRRIFLEVWRAHPTAIYLDENGRYLRLPSSALSECMGPGKRKRWSVPESVELPQSHSAPDGKVSQQAALEEVRRSMRIDPKVDRAWREQLAVLESAVSGTYSEHEFLAATDFFFEVTGIRVRYMLTPIGPLLVPGTRADVLQLHHWYERRGHELVWDSAAQKVVRSDDQVPGLLRE